MNKLYTLLLVLTGSLSNAQKQDISIQNLVECTFMQKESFDSYARNKGFTTFNTALDKEAVYERQNKSRSIKHFLLHQQIADTTSVVLQTTSHTEFTDWRKELQEAGFSYYKDKDKQEEDLYPIFQKRNIIARLSLQYNNDQTLYSLKVENIRLPDISEIRFAEDLLQLTTHEYIAAVFGVENVKQDVFYFSEQEVNKCSILFPNTSNQVIFIWNDEINKRDIAFLLLGGQATNQGNAAIYSGNVFHKWRSKQGVHLGMTLRELQQLNNEPIEFYGWDTEQPGFVKNNNKGTINFNRLGLQLQCLDCNSNSAAILSSKEVLKTSDRIYVSSMIILPDRKAVR